MKERSGKAQKIGAYFIEAMLCLTVDKLPEGPAWQYEVKLDGYRAIAVRTKAGVELWSLNKRDFTRRFKNVARALEALPVETVPDGEIVAVNGDGQPSFSSLQNFGDGAAAILFYAFDAPVLPGADLRSKPLAIRRQKLGELIRSRPDTIRFSETFETFTTELMEADRDLIPNARISARAFHTPKNTRSGGPYGEAEMGSTFHNRSSSSRCTRSNLHPHIWVHRNVN